MNWCRNKHSVLVPTLHSDRRSLTAMRRASICDPENAPCRAVRFPSHRLSDQPMKRFNPSCRFTSSCQSGPPDVPSCQVRPRSLALVLVLVAQLSSRRGRRGGMTTRPCLDTCLFVRREHVFIVLQSFALPQALVQIQNHSSLFGKLRIARKDPATMTPRTNRIRRQPAPNGCPADLCHDPLFNCGAGNFTTRKPRERQIELRRQFAGKGFDLHDDLRGKTLAYARCAPDRSSRLHALQNTGASISKRSVLADQAVSRSRCWYSLRSPSRRSSRARPLCMEPCTFGREIPTPLVRPNSTRSRKGLFGACLFSLIQVCHAQIDKDLEKNTSPYL